MRPIARAALLAFAGTVVLASCTSSSAPPPPPPGTKTYWLAPIGSSEVNLRLATAQPTVPF
jgi:predicted component of type VI protein secretion system